MAMTTRMRRSEFFGAMIRIWSRFTSVCWGCRVVGGDVPVDRAHVRERVLEPTDVHAYGRQRVRKLGGGAGSSPRARASR
jgi:hypothetical protein